MLTFYVHPFSSASRGARLLSRKVIGNMKAALCCPEPYQIQSRVQTTFFASAEKEKTQMILQKPRHYVHEAFPHPQANAAQHNRNRRLLLIPSCLLAVLATWFLYLMLLLHHFIVQHLNRSNELLRVLISWTIYDLKQHFPAQCSSLVSPKNK